MAPMAPLLWCVHPHRGRHPQGGCSVMFTILTTWISERIITVTAVSVLTVAAVPTTLIIVSHDDHNTIAVVQPADEHSKVVLVSAVKKAGDAVIARLNTAESGCTTQVTQAVTTSKVAAKVQPQLVKAKSQLHGSVAPAFFFRTSQPPKTCIRGPSAAMPPPTSSGSTR